MAIPLKEFRKEFRNHVDEYATAYQIITQGGVSGTEEKTENNDEYYEKLEKWVLERFNSWIIDGKGKVTAIPEKEESVEIEWPIEKNHDTDLDF